MQRTAATARLTPKPARHRRGQPLRQISDREHLECLGGDVRGQRRVAEIGVGPTEFAHRPLRAVTLRTLITVRTNRGLASVSMPRTTSPAAVAVWAA